jgi:hypothetical protein
MRAVYTNGRIPLSTRVKCMVEAAPYVHPKLSAAMIVDGKDFAARLDRAVARSQQAKPKVIEGPKVINQKSIADEIEEIQPIVTVPDRRYRR